MRVLLFTASILSILTLFSSVVVFAQTTLEILSPVDQCEQDFFLNSSYTANPQISYNEINAILRANNDARRSVSPFAKTMPMLKWDENLATLARDYIVTCPGLAHSTYAYRTGKFGYSLIGENVAGGTYENEYGNATGGLTSSLAWISERETKNWTYGCRPFDSQSVCYNAGHYTQIIWSYGNRMGCGSAYCPEQQFLKYLWVCMYSQSQFQDMDPYQNTSNVGDAASCTREPTTTSTTGVNTSTTSSSNTTTITPIASSTSNSVQPSSTTISGSNSTTTVVASSTSTAVASSSTTIVSTTTATPTTPPPTTSTAIPTPPATTTQTPTPTTQTTTTAQGTLPPPQTFGTTLAPENTTTSTTVSATPPPLPAPPTEPPKVPSIGEEMDARGVFTFLALIASICHGPSLILETQMSLAGFQFSRCQNQSYEEAVRNLEKPLPFPENLLPFVTVGDAQNGYFRGSLVMNTIVVPLIVAGITILYGFIMFNKTPPEKRMLLPQKPQQQQQQSSSPQQQQQKNTSSSSSSDSKSAPLLDKNNNNNNNENKDGGGDSNKQSEFKKFLVTLNDWMFYGGTQTAVVVFFALGTDGAIASIGGISASPIESSDYGGDGTLLIMFMLLFGFINIGASKYIAGKTPERFLSGDSIIVRVPIHKKPAFTLSPEMMEKVQSEKFGKYWFMGNHCWRPSSIKLLRYMSTMPFLFKWFHGPRVEDRRVAMADLMGVDLKKVMASQQQQLQQQKAAGASSSPSRNNNSDDGGGIGSSMLQVRYRTFIWACFFFVHLCFVCFISLVRGIARVQTTPGDCQGMAGAAAGIEAVFAILVMVIRPFVVPGRNITSCVVASFCCLTSIIAAAGGSGSAVHGMTIFTTILPFLAFIITSVPRCILQTFYLVMPMPSNLQKQLDAINNALDQQEADEERRKQEEAEKRKKEEEEWLAEEEERRKAEEAAQKSLADVLREQEEQEQEQNVAAAENQGNNEIDELDENQNLSPEEKEALAMKQQSIVNIENSNNTINPDNVEEVLGDEEMQGRSRGLSQINNNKNNNNHDDDDSYVERMLGLVVAPQTPPEAYLQAAADADINLDTDEDDDGEEEILTVAEQCALMGMDEKDIQQLESIAKPSTNLKAMSPDALQQQQSQQQQNSSAYFSNNTPKNIKTKNPSWQPSEGWSSSTLNNNYDKAPDWYQDHLQQSESQQQQQQRSKNDNNYNNNSGYDNNDDDNDASYYSNPNSPRNKRVMINEGRNLYHEHPQNNNNNNNSSNQQKSLQDLQFVDVRQPLSTDEMKSILGFEVADTSAQSRQPGQQRNNMLTPTAKQYMKQFHQRQTDKEEEEEEFPYDDPRAKNDGRRRGGSNNNRSRQQGSSNKMDAEKKKREVEALLDDVARHAAGSPRKNEARHLLLLPGAEPDQDIELGGNFNNNNAAGASRAGFSPTQQKSPRNSSSSYNSPRKNNNARATSATSAPLYQSFGASEHPDDRHPVNPRNVGEMEKMLHDAL